MVLVWYGMNVQRFSLNWHEFTPRPTNPNSIAVSKSKKGCITNDNCLLIAVYLSWLIFKWAEDNNAEIKSIRLCSSKWLHWTCDFYYPLVYCYSWPCYHFHPLRKLLFRTNKRPFIPILFQFIAPFYL